MIVILARASARYQGRIDAELSLGDVCILVRDHSSGGDGSVLLHDMASGIPPRNWMPAGSVMSEIDGGYRFEHEKREESLEVYIETVYSEIQHRPELPSKLSKLGAEREFSDLLARSLHLLSKLELIDREWRTPAGPVDLLCQDPLGNPVVVEVKRRTIDPNAIWQVRRYLHTFADDPAWRGKMPRGIVVAPSLQKTAQRMLQDFPDITFVRVTYDQLKLLAETPSDKGQIPTTAEILGLVPPGETSKRSSGSSSNEPLEG